MEAPASGKTEKARARSSAAKTAAAEASVAAGASASVSGALEARSSRMTRSMARAAAAAQTGLSTDPVVRLPAALAQSIFLLLPVHDRMRSRGVSRAWRAALADRGCWRVLRFAGCEDLPLVRRAYDGLEQIILAAIHASGGAVEEIDARGLNYNCLALFKYLSWLPEETRRSLRAIRVSGTHMSSGVAGSLDHGWVAFVIESGGLPRLEELEADVRASVSEARRLLDDARQPDSRLKALRIRTLDIHANDDSIDLAEFVRSAARGHPSLTGLTLNDMPNLHPGLINAVADAAVACGLESLHLASPLIDHTCIPALSRALRCGRLRSLVLTASWELDANSRAGRLDGPRSAHAEFCAALRGSRLETLRLRGMRLWADPNNGCTLLAAVTTHPTLRRLDVSWNDCGDAASKAAAAEAVAALLEANTPALKSLRIDSCGFDLAHLERIFGALRGNTHLAALACFGVEADTAFAERVMLPFLRANTTLRTLWWHGFECGEVGKEIDGIMRARAARSPSVTWA